jgi:hypothetical protein
LRQLSGIAGPIAQSHKDAAAGSISERIKGAFSVDHRSRLLHQQI